MTLDSRKKVSRWDGLSVLVPMLCVGMHTELSEIIIYNIIKTLHRILINAD